MRLLAVLLAAGGGSRFGGPGHKLDADLGSGRSVYDQSLAHLLASGVGSGDGAGVVVVHGATQRPVPDEVTAVANVDWASGQAGSLALALDIARQRQADAVVVGLADQPFIEPAAWRAVADAPPEWPIVVATYDGARGPHPVRLHRSVWPLIPVIGDDGARYVVRELSDRVLEVPCPGASADIDTLEDLQRWTNS